MTVRVLLLIAIVAAAIVTGCSILSAPPDQRQFAPLESLRNNGSAVARIYNAPIPDIGAVASHTWLVVKEADATSFDWWEVWQVAWPNRRMGTFDTTSCHQRATSKQTAPMWSPR